MATPKISKRIAQEAVTAYETALAEGCISDGIPSAMQRASQLIGKNHSVMRNRLNKAKELYGLVPNMSVKKIEVTKDEEAPPDVEELRLFLNRGPKTIAQIVSDTKFKTVGQVMDGIEELFRKGVNIYRQGEEWSISKTLPAAKLVQEPLRYYSRPDNTYIFGAVGDQHVGSQHCRYDVLENLYDRFAEAGVDRVFNTGNWIEGDANFNKFEVVARGIHAQCKLLAEKFPKREGIETYAVWGDDHEGWYAQREGLDVGRYGENVLREAGRADWHNLGFMEANVELININTGAKATLLVCHPGGGSAYAISYAIQKIIESYEGGEKPDVGLYGHYHKLWAGMIRNVWVAQTGCTCDQTTFMRKRRIEAQVGGTLIELEQHPETGAIIAFKPQMLRYFNEEWYKTAGLANRRWGYVGDIQQMPRSVKAIK